MLAYPEPVTQGAADAPVGTTHRVQAETSKTPVPRPLTEDVPRIYPRRLPDPTHRELLRRSRTIAKVVAIHFTPTAFRQLRTIRQGPLPAAQLARPLQELPGPGRDLHEVRPDHRLVAGHVR